MRANARGCAVARTEAERGARVPPHPRRVCSPEPGGASRPAGNPGPPAGDLFYKATFLSASPRDIPVPCFQNWRLAAVAPQRRKSRQNSQAGKPALPRLWNPTSEFGLSRISGDLVELDRSVFEGLAVRPDIAVCNAIQPRFTRKRPLTREPHFLYVLVGLGRITRITL